MQLPLEDVKILFVIALAGPFCSTMLGDFGAQVVKVEVPGAGDIARGWGPPFIIPRPRTLSVCTEQKEH